MLTTGIFPDVFKISKIIPVYKKGDANVLSNYRPISLLPTMSKIFERVIYNQLYAYFARNSLLSEQQYGFRAKHSTELAGIKLIDYIHNEIDKKKTPVNIFIDLSKAFDTLDFDILLHKLKYYGLCSTAYTLIETYLRNRKQYVKCGKHESNFTAVITGVPQGSILGPLLFSIYINDIVHISNKFKYLMYADDTTLYFNMEDFPKTDRVESVNNELNKVNDWLQHNKLSLNADKTKCMTFHTCQKKIQYVSYSMNSKQIENVSQFKFLGLILDEQLSWRNHTDMITNKLSKVVGILNKLKHVYPKQALFSIYNCLFLSHINYGLLLWGTNLAKVDIIQKRALRIITQSDYRAHSEPLFKAHETLKVHDMFHLKLLKFYYNLSYGTLPSYFNCYQEYLDHEPYSHYNLRQGSRPLLRTPKTRLVLTESCVLYQLVKIINITNRQNPEILDKIVHKSHTYSGFNFNVTQIYLQSYKYECTVVPCYTCNRK